jgi:hypothetical protein
VRGGVREEREGKEREKRERERVVATLSQTRCCSHLGARMGLLRSGTLSALTSEIIFLNSITSGPL